MRGLHFLSWTPVTGPTVRLSVLAAGKWSGPKSRLLKLVGRAGFVPPISRAFGIFG
jgi:hypothetical protein